MCIRRAARPSLEAEGNPLQSPSSPYLCQRAQVLLRGAVVLPCLQPVCRRKVPGIVVQHNDRWRTRQARQLAQQLLKATACGVGQRRLGRLIEAGGRAMGERPRRAGI